MSAAIWRQSGDFEPPPIRRISRGLKPSLRNASNPPRIANTADSSEARAIFARLVLAEVKPVMLARPFGKFGVLSPLKNGITRTPSDPQGALAASPSSSFTSIWKSPRTNSVATVQFIVQSKGSHPPVEEQKPLKPFAGSLIGLSEYP